MKMTHKDRVLKYMQDNGGITTLDAIKHFGNTRLSASIWILRHKDGFDIEAKKITVPTRYGKTRVALYKLKEENK